MTRLRAHSRTIRRTVLATAIAWCFAPASGIANPVGPAIVHGQASFQTQGKSLTVTNSPGTIINWQGFSIGAGEATRFVQQSAASAVLNRVVGRDASTILGALQSNGRVFLINPNGILIGAGAQIDTAGLIASTLNMKDADFLLGKMRFGDTPGAGPLSNAGEIRTPLGGRVLLISPQGVENSGIIHSPKGDVILAAGKTVELTDSAHPEVRVEISAPEARAVNLGKIVAESGRIGIYGGIVANHGVVSADSAVVGESGKIIFKASHEARLEAGSLASASGPSGGSVEVHSEGTTLVAGRVEATGSAAGGGEVRLLGSQVGLIENGSVDVSGDRGGGTVLIGGDLQGANSSVQNARATYTGADTSIKADAGTSGDGGKVIVWADDTTRSYGAISARGGATGGDGGFVETSGKQGLDVRRGPDLRAPAGKSGTWLLDPVDLEVVAGSEFDTTINSGAPFFAPLAESSRIGVNLINAQLDFGSNVILTTTSQGADSGAQLGNLTISAPIVKTAKSTNDVFIGTTSLTLQAHNNIVIGPGGSITSTGDPLNVTLQANSDGMGGGGVSVGSSVVTRGGFFSASGADAISVNAAIDTRNAAGTSGNSQSFTSTNGAVTLAGALTGGFISANANGGALSVAAPITSTSSVLLTGRDGVSIAGGVNVTTGAFSSLSATATAANASFDIGPAATVSSRGAFLVADNVNIQGVVNANSGSISVRPATAGRGINLGTETGGALSITQAEFSNLQSTGSLTIGDSSAGAMTVSGPISGSPSFVSLQSGTSYTQNAGISLSSSLTIEAPTITIAAPLAAAGTSGIGLYTDSLLLSSSISASGGALDINTWSFNRPIALGITAPTGSALELSDSQLDMLATPGVLRFSTDGAINIVGAISPANAAALSLSSFSGSVTQATNAPITVPSLAVYAGSSIDLPAPNDVGTFAAETCCSTSSINFVAAPNKLVNIGTVDGFSGVTVLNFSGTGNITLQADDLNVTQVIYANAGDVKLTPTTAARAITLGGSAANTLSLDSNEVGLIQGTNVTFSADAIDIPTAVSFLAPMTVLGPASANRAVNIVGAKTGNALELTPGEIGNITGGSVVLGGANAGPVSVLAGTTVPASISKFVLHSGSSSVTVGLSTPLSATNSLGITADTVDLQSGVSSSNGNIEITTHTATRKIDVGSDPGSSLGLSVAEIGSLSAPSGAVSFTTAGGNIDVNSGVSFPNVAALTFEAGNTFTLFTAGTLSSGGALSVRAPTISIQGMTTTNASGGSLSLIGNNIDIVPAATTLAASGDINVAPRDFRAINLGASGSGTDLRLDNSELAVLNPAGLLRIGDASTTSNISMTAAISLPGETVGLNTGSGNITQSAGASLSAASLVAKAFGAITLNEANQVGTVALQSDFSSISFTRAPGAALSVGSVDGVDGIFAGAAQTATPMPVTLRADQINIDQQVRGSTVTLLPSAGGDIDIGTRSGFGFEQADFNRIVANSIVIGESASADVTITAPVSVGGFSNLTLIGGSAGNVNAALTVPGGLSITSGSLATTAAVTSSGGNVTLVADALTLGAAVNANETITVRPLTGTVRIDLGGADAAGVLGIDAAEFSNLSALSLVLGATPRVDISAPVTSAHSLALITDDLTLPGAGIQLTAPNLSVTTVTAGRTIDLGTDGAGTFLGLSDATLGKLSLSNSLSFSAPGASTLLVSAPVSVPSDLSLSARTININDTLIAGGDLTLRSDVALNIAAGKTASSSSGDITVAPRAGAMTFGAGGILDSAVLGRLVAPTGFLVLGYSMGFHTSGLNIAQPLNASSFSGLKLLAHGNISQTPGSTITATQLEVTGSGDVTLTENNAISGSLTGDAGGFFRSFAFTNGSALEIGTVGGVSGVHANSGAVMLRAPSLNITQPIVANTVTLAPAVAATPISLGTDSGFGLTDAEINLVFANTLNIGVNSGNASGPITVAGTVDRAFGNLNLTTAPGSSISVNAPLSASSGTLFMNAGAGGSVSIAAPVTASGNITANADSIVTSQQITSSSGSVTLNNLGTSGSVTVGGPVDAFFSINVNGKTILVDAPLTANYAFSTINLSALSGTSGSSVTINQQLTAGSSISITTDNIAINAPVVTTGSSVSLQPRSANVPISIGTETPGAFSLSSSEIALIDTDQLSIGNSSAGDLVVNAPLTGTFESLSLSSGGDVTQTPGSTITVRRVDPNDPSNVSGSLSVFAGGAINLPEANDVAVSLSGQASGTANDFVFNNVSPLKLQNVSGVFATGKLLIRTATPPATPDSVAFDSNVIANTLLSDIFRSPNVDDAENRAEERLEEGEKKEREEDKERGRSSCS